MKCSIGVNRIQYGFAQQIQMNKLGHCNNLFSKSMPMRAFSSLPDHIKLEMPNLSPTMEKVSVEILFYLFFIIGKYWIMEQANWRYD